MTDGEGGKIQVFDDKDRTKWVMQNTGGPSTEWTTTHKYTEAEINKFQLSKPIRRIPE